MLIASALLPSNIVLKLDVLFNISSCCGWNFSICEHSSELSKVTRHNLAGSKPSTCILESERQVSAFGQQFLYRGLSLTTCHIPTLLGQSHFTLVLQSVTSRNCHRDFCLASTCWRYRRLTKYKMGKHQLRLTRSVSALIHGMWIYNQY